MMAPQRDCKYGMGCRRKNPVHWQQFSHPSAPTRNITPVQGQKDAQKPSSKASSSTSYPSRCGLKQVNNLELNCEADGSAIQIDDDSDNDFKCDTDGENENDDDNNIGDDIDIDDEDDELLQQPASCSTACEGSTLHSEKKRSALGVVSGATCVTQNIVEGDEDGAPRKRKRTVAPPVTNFPASLDIEVALAHKYKQGLPIKKWLMSEKLDGMRCIWNSEDSLFSRAGNRVHAPKTFMDALPRGIVLDGELFLGRGKFQECMSIVRSHIPDEKRWSQIKYVVFDAPSQRPFVERVQDAKDAVAASTEPSTKQFVQVLDHTICLGHQHIENELKRVEAVGGEGLMLRNPLEPYRGGRIHDLLKVKSSHDAEALVIGHVPGKGKHEGRLGALLCRMPDSKNEFKVGTGFTDADRMCPPKIGCMVTYSYFELTKASIPRFPAFVHVRPSE